LSEPLVTVVIPASGVASTLARSVRSALDGQGVETEVIIVDDASQSGDAEEADRLLDPPLISVVHRRSPGGPAAARNEGLRRARGRNVVFLDGDDRLRPGALRSLCAALEGSSVAAMGRFQAVDEGDDPVDIGTWAAEQLRPVVRRGGSYVPSDAGFTDEAMMTRLVTPPPGAIVVRRDDALAIGGFDVTARRSEDLDFLVRLSERGPIVAVDQTVLDYRRRRQQRSQNSRARQLGRQRVLASLIWCAPDAPTAVARARGAASHHLDRAATRARHGEGALNDAWAVARSLGLAVFFTVAGAFAALRRLG
jgi:glycosyltransferase involved in cell wall biosynthesis